MKIFVARSVVIDVHDNVSQQGIVLLGRDDAMTKGGVLCRGSYLLASFSSLCTTFIVSLSREECSRTRTGAAHSYTSKCMHVYLCVSHQIEKNQRETERKRHQQNVRLANLRALGAHTTTSS